jgi:hypothetical protein
MPASYEKRIASGSTPDGSLVGLYVVVVDSTPTSYYLTAHGSRFASYGDKAAAEARFKAVRGGFDLPPAPPDADTFDALAAEVEAHQSRQLFDVSFPLLASLEQRAIARRGRGSTHGRVAQTLARAVGTGKIPTKPGAFLEWAEATLHLLIDDAKTKSSCRVRSAMFLRCLNQISNYPLAFKSYAPGLALALKKLQATRTEVMTQSESAVNRRPFSKLDIERMLTACSSLSDFILCLSYLALGPRSGDGEKMSYAHIVEGLYVLDEIISKKRTGKTPPAPLVLRVVLRLARDLKLAPGTVPEDFDRRRFRSTCGVYSVMSGVDPLTVSEMLGHADMTMITRHYVRRKPDGYAGSKNVAAYLGVAPVHFAGFTSGESAWNNFLLFKLLERARTDGILEEVKKLIIAESGGEVVILAAGGF